MSLWVSGYCQLPANTYHWNYLLSSEPLLLTQVFQEGGHRFLKSRGQISATVLKHLLSHMYGQHLPHVVFHGLFPGEFGHTSISLTLRWFNPTSSPYSWAAVTAKAATTRAPVTFLSRCTEALFLFPATIKGLKVKWWFSQQGPSQNHASQVSYLANANRR